MKKIILNVSHVSTCLPDYWAGDANAHIQVFAYRGMRITELRRELHSELNSGGISGNDERTRDDSGAIGDSWLKAAHAAIDRDIKLADKKKRLLFMDLEPQGEDDDNSDSVYAYFVFTDKDA